MTQNGREVLTDEKQRDAERQALRSARKLVDRLEAEVQSQDERDRGFAFVLILLAIVVLVIAVPFVVIPWIVK
jgi:hypothetical protein